MYEVKLVKIDTEKEVLGNLDGQGFYPYKKVSTVVNKLYDRMKHIPKQYKTGYRYDIYCGSDWLHTDKKVMTLPIK